eukprot:1584162-Lingulodinium_polyedra.AAC.1
MSRDERRRRDGKTQNHLATDNCNNKRPQNAAAAATADARECDRRTDARRGTHENMARTFHSYS